MGADPRIHISKDIGPRIARFTVNVPIAPLRARASHQAGQETELLFGQHFDVYKLRRGWAWGQAVSPVKGSRQKGYVGYVPAKMLTDETITPNFIVTAMGAPVFSKADIKSPVQYILPLNARVKGRGKSFVDIGHGFVDQRHLRKITLALERINFVTIAEQHLGLPYIWGGISSHGLDCSGLVQSSLRAIGHDTPRDTDMQEVSLGDPLPIRQSSLKRGDLIFWKGHVGIMQNGSQMIHANAFHMKVSSEPLRGAVKRIAATGGGGVTSVKRL